MSDYELALKRGREIGASRADDAAAMALFCNAPLQTLVGAVSPQLVWEGAQALGLTLMDLACMCVIDREGVAELMWLMSVTREQLRSAIEAGLAVAARHDMTDDDRIKLWRVGETATEVAVGTFGAHHDGRLVRCPMAMAFPAYSSVSWDLTFAAAFDDVMRSCLTFDSTNVVTVLP